VRSSVSFISIAAHSVSSGRHLYSVVHERRTQFGSGVYWAAEDVPGVGIVCGFGGSAGTAAKLPGSADI
jgi:hypothetical protein